MAGNYPVWLRSTIDPAHNLTAANSAAAPYGLRVALVWWSLGITLAGGYFVYVFRSIRGKVGSVIDPHGY
jgi:cytochrome d ubiquinol oxidase subunit II